MKAPRGQAAQAEAMAFQAETLVAAARAACARVGLVEADANVVLAHALGMSVADACGPKADRLRLEEGTILATGQVTRAVALYHRERTIPNAGGARG